MKVSMSKLAYCVLAALVFHVTIEQVSVSAASVIYGGASAASNKQKQQHTGSSGVVQLPDTQRGQYAPYDHELDPEREEFAEGPHSGVVTPSNIGVVSQLLRKLFSNYNKAAQLVRPLVVHMELLLIKVKSAIEKEGVFESVIAIFIEWQDARLEWDPAMYANITHLSLDPDEVGLPDIAMTNSADHLYAITRDNRFNVRVSYDGSLKYVPTGTARTWCDFKLMKFPFDTQKCTLEFESWSLDSSAMTFDGTSVLRLDTSFVSQLWTICQWKAVTYDHTYFTNETFTRVRFDIAVKRKSTFYIINLIFPCTTLSLIQMLVFMISSTDSTSDRIGFGTTNLLTLVVFQTIVTEELPKTSDAVTALSKYIIALIITSAVGIFESVFVERMMTTYEAPPSIFLQRLFRLFPVTFREVAAKKRSDSENTDSKQPEQGYEMLSHRGSTTSYVLDSPLMMRRPTATLCNEPGAWPLAQLDSNTRRHNPWQYQQQPPQHSHCMGNESAHSFIDKNGRRRSSYQFAVSDHFAQSEPSRNGRRYSCGYKRPRVAFRGGRMCLQCCNNKFSESEDEYFGALDYSRMSNRSSHNIKTIINGNEQRRQSNGNNYNGNKSQNNLNNLQNQQKDKSEATRNNKQSGIKSKTVVRRNRQLWKEIGYKIDFITFISCSLLVVTVPMALFLPLALLEDDSCVPLEEEMTLEY